MGDVRPRHQRIDRAAQVQRRAVAGRAVVEIARIGRDPGMEPGDVARRRIGADQQDIGDGRQQGDDAEPRRAVEGRRVHGQRRHHEADAAHQQRVAVRLRLQHGAGADGRSSAGAVLRHHRLAERGAHPGRHQPGGDVGRAAGGEGDDQGYGVVGEAVLRQGGPGQQGGGGEQGTAAHGRFLRQVAPGIEQIGDERKRPGTRAGRPRPRVPSDQTSTMSAAVSAGLPTTHASRTAGSAPVPSSSHSSAPLAAW